MFLLFPVFASIVLGATNSPSFAPSTAAPTCAFTGDTNPNLINSLVDNDFAEPVQDIPTTTATTAPTPYTGVTPNKLYRLDTRCATGPRAAYLYRTDYVNGNLLVLTDYNLTGWKSSGTVNLAFGNSFIFNHPTPEPNNYYTSGQINPRLHVSTDRALLAFTTVNTVSSPPDSLPGGGASGHAKLENIPSGLVAYFMFTKYGDFTTNAVGFYQMLRANSNTHPLAVYWGLASLSPTMVPTAAPTTKLPSAPTSVPTLSRDFTPLEYPSAALITLTTQVSVTSSSNVPNTMEQNIEEACGALKMISTFYYDTCRYDVNGAGNPNFASVIISSSSPTGRRLLELYTVVITMFTDAAHSQESVDKLQSFLHSPAFLTAFFNDTITSESVQVGQTLVTVSACAASFRAFTRACLCPANMSGVAACPDLCAQYGRTDCQEAVSELSNCTTDVGLGTVVVEVNGRVSAASCVVSSAFKVSTAIGSWIFIAFCFHFL